MIGDRMLIQQLTAFVVGVGLCGGGGSSPFSIQSKGLFIDSCGNPVCSMSVYLVFGDSPKKFAVSPVQTSPICLKITNRNRALNNFLSYVSIAKR